MEDHRRALRCAERQIPDRFFQQHKHHLIDRLITRLTSFLRQTDHLIKRKIGMRHRHQKIPIDLPHRLAEGHVGFQVDTDRKRIEKIPHQSLHIGMLPVSDGDPGHEIGLTRASCRIR